MKMVYNVYEAGFEEKFPNFHVVDSTNDKRLIPSSFNFYYDFLIEMGTLDSLIYSFFLQVSGFYPPVNGVEEERFFRIYKTTLAEIMHCGMSSLDASLKRLVDNEWLFVVREYGKANAYCART